MTTPVEWLNEFQVNIGTANVSSLAAPKTIGLSNGNFLVAWVEGGTDGVATNAGQDIIGKIFDAEGSVVRDSYRLNSGRTADNETDFDIAATNDGGFILVYMDNDISSPGDTDIIYQRHDSDGDTGGPVVISDETTDDFTFSNPQIAVNLQDNTSVLQFQNNVSGDTGIFLRELDPFGIVVSATTVDDGAAEDEFDGDIAMLSNGNIVSAWTDENGATDDGVQFKIQQTNGVTIAGPFQQDPTGRDPRVTALADGNFVMVWEDYNTENGNIIAQIFAPSGNFVASIDVAVGSDDQNEPDVIALPDGGFVVVWDNDTANVLFAQRFNADGSTDGARFTVENVGTTVPTLGVTGDGRILFSWIDEGTNSVFSSIWDPRDSPVNPADYELGTPIFVDTGAITTRTSSTTVNVTPGTTQVLGQAGNDTFVFDDPDDLTVGDDFRGEIGSDTLLFDARAATFELGNATLQGIEEIQFGNLGAGQMVIRMDAFQVGAGGFASGGTIDFSFGLADRLEVIMGTDGAVSLAGFVFQDYNNRTEDQIHIIGDGSNELMIGSSVDDDIFGNGGNDDLRGGDGNDLLDGGSGADGMTGGDGNDQYIYDNAGDAIIESGAITAGFDAVLSLQTVNLSNAATFAGRIEAATLNGNANANAIGNIVANVLTGNAGMNVLNGLAGADNMRGRGGSDTYVVDNAGDIVNESLAGSSGFDRVLSSVTVNFSNTAQIIGAVERAELTGSGNINATGNILANSMVGNSGNNVLNGLNGNDVLTGNGGNDAFYFSFAVRAGNVDTILDYNLVQDRLWLEGSVFTALGPNGPIAGTEFRRFGSGPQDANDFLLYDQANGRIFYDADANGGGAAVLFAVVTPGLNLDSGDFLVV